MLSSVFANQQADNRHCLGKILGVLLEATAVVKPIIIPQARPPPKHFIEGADAHQPKSAKDYYREEFFKVLDIVDAQLSELFNQDDLLTLQKLEETLLSGKIDAAVIEKYPELNRVTFSATFCVSPELLIQQQCRGC
ncbi:hypothetical protein L3Q82_016688, partial [Scortum barcoo]